MKKLLLFFIYIFIYNNIECIQVGFDIKPNKNFVIGEFLTEDTVAIFSIKTKNKNLEVELHDPKGSILYTKKNRLEVRASLTVKESGNYEIWVKNKDKEIVQVEYELLTGIQAQDYSQFAKESSIQPAEDAIIKLKDMSKGLIKVFNKVVKEEDKNLKVNDIISGKIPMVSLITISVMIAVGLIEFIYIRKYLQNRKLI